MRIYTVRELWSLVEGARDVEVMLRSDADELVVAFAKAQGDKGDDECEHWMRTRYVGCGGRAVWICDACGRNTGAAEREPPRPVFKIMLKEDYGEYAEVVPDSFAEGETGWIVDEKGRAVAWYAGCGTHCMTITESFAAFLRGETRATATPETPEGQQENPT